MRKAFLENGSPTLKSIDERPSKVVGLRCELGQVQGGWVVVVVVAELA